MKACLNVLINPVSDDDRELYSQWRFQLGDKSAIVAAAVVE